MQLATAARLVLYNRSKTAELIIQKSPTIARHIQVIDGVTSFTNQPRYEAELAFAKSRELDDEISTIREIIKLDDSGFHTKKLQHAENKSRMWRAGTRKLFLSALEISPNKIVHEEIDITNGLRGDWQPIFQKKPDPTLMKSAQNQLLKHVPDLSDHWSKIGPPQSHDYQIYSHSCPPAMPGLDQLPYCAWDFPEGGATLQECSFLSASGLNPATNWNQQLMIFAPKGSRESDTSGKVARTSLQCRPLSLKNSDNKIVAGVGNNRFKILTRDTVHRWQNGFIFQRNFLNNVVTIDAVSRSISFGKEAIARLPILASFDFESAFPSLFHDFLEWYLAATGMPESLHSWVMSFFAWCVASVREGSGYTFFLLIMSGIIQGCPLSGTLFALSSHPLLAFIEEYLKQAGDKYNDELFQGHSLAQACADDIGTVVAAMPMLSALAQPFAVMEAAAGLTLKPSKCNLVPLIPFSDAVTQRIKKILVETLPQWKK